ncbi:differentially expressed in FDCP 6-like [Diadema setosum]|uniref:differentially expressed in FDCP 6-like n=1 Tax=Diadema setosum TaxID=31175 RepID=UPI003B3A6333
MADKSERNGSCSSTDTSTMSSSASSSNSSESKSNTLSTRSSYDIYDTDDTKSGWLWKRSRVSKKWKKRWFTLRRAELMYGHDAETLNKRIPLDGTALSDSCVDQKSHVFKLQPENNNRTFFLQASNDADQLEWMSAICFAKAACQQPDKSQSCVIQ